MEIEIIRESREYKAADTLSEAHNAMGFNHQNFAQGIIHQHPTIQQSIMRSIIATLRLMASPDYRYDLRNRSTHEAAKKLVESGILDEIYLPFV